MTDLISNSVRRDTQNVALLSANFGPAYVEENSYSCSIQISKTPADSIVQARNKMLCGLTKFSMKYGNVGNQNML